ncbi:hypothetical protein [Arthrobacter sp. 92]|uniref:hypothetical protein n=1 Tax=Arthrobacter sp. 92 TaxID=3418175 RepID=UPI003CFFC799
MADLQHSDHLEAPLAPEVRFRLGDGGYYRYRGRRKPDAVAVQAERIRQFLRKDRQRIYLYSSSMRALAVRLNEQVAQALCDGLKITGLAEAAGLSRWAVRTIGLSSDDLMPSGLPAGQQLAAISRLKSELAELEESKTELEARRLKLLAAGRRLGVMDDYELAALSGLQSEAVRKMTWGLQHEAEVIPA